MELKIYNQQGVFKTAVSPSDSDRHVKEVMNSIPNIMIYMNLKEL